MLNGWLLFKKAHHLIRRRHTPSLHHLLMRPFLYQFLPLIRCTSNRFLATLCSALVTIWVQLILFGLLMKWDIRLRASVVLLVQIFRSPMTALALKILLKTKLSRFARRWACWLSSNPTFLTSVLVFLIVHVSILVFPLSSITHVLL